MLMVSRLQMPWLSGKRPCSFGADGVESEPGMLGLRDLHAGLTTLRRRVVPASASLPTM